jgi:hypothetical protein
MVWLVHWCSRQDGTVAFIFFRARPCWSAAGTSWTPRPFEQELICRNACSGSTCLSYPGTGAADPDLTERDELNN